MKLPFFEVDNLKKKDSLKGMFHVWSVPCEKKCHTEKILYGGHHVGTEIKEENYEQNFETRKLENKQRCTKRFNRF